MEKLDRNFADFLKSLNAHGVEYLVVGGYGVSFDRCYGKRAEETIDGVRVCFIDRESLLLNKQAAGRPKDLADIEALTRSPKEPRN